MAFRMKRRFKGRIGFDALRIVGSTQLASVNVGSTYSSTLSASGGTPSYTFSALNSLPSGLTMDPFTGTIAGTPSSAAASTFSLQVQDGVGSTARQSFALTVTSTQLAIAITSSTNLLASVVGSSYSFTFQSTGGAPPYSSYSAVNALPSGFSLSSSGGLTGTPVSTGASTFTIQVKDNSGSTASKQFSLTALSSGSHAYFNSLITSTSLFKAVSLRPISTVTSTSSPYWSNQLNKGGGGFAATAYDPHEPLAFTYNPGSDTHVSAQDACKHILPPFIRVSSNALIADVSSAATGDVTVLQCSTVTTSYAVGFEMKIDDEVMTITARDLTLDTITVTRGQHGTTAAAHTSGAATKRITHTTPSILRIPVNTGDALSRYLFTWDAYYTDSYVATGLTNHKYFQIASGGSAIWLETNNAYAPGSAEIGSFVSGVDVAALQARSYSAAVETPCTNREPIEPISNTFAVKPNKWTRYWQLVDVKYAKDDDAGYFDCGLTLNANIVDTTGTSISVAGAGITALNTGFTVFRQYMKIDSEIIMCLVNNSGAFPRTITVTRGALGTTAATHTAGAVVRQLVNAEVSMWIADEDRDPVAHFLNMPVTVHGDGGGAGDNSIDDFEYEINTSTDEWRDRSTRELISYHRNWVCLKRATLDPVAEGLLVKPVA